MSLWLRTLMESPPGGHKFHVEQTGTWIPKEGSHHAYSDLRDEVVRHFNANRIPLPPDLDAVIQTQRCRTLPSGWCRDDQGKPWLHGGGSQLTLASLRQATLTFVHWLMKGGKRVDDAEIHRRSLICSTCPYNRMPDECVTCGGSEVRQLLNEVVGGDRQPLDDRLNACMICGCGLKAKTRVPLDAIQKAMSKEQVELFPAHCWLKQTSSV